MTTHQRHNTTLTADTVATLKAYGGGNLSEGIRRAAELVRQTESATGPCGLTVPKWVTHHGQGRPDKVEPDTLILYQTRDAAVDVGRDLYWFHEDDAHDIMVYTVIKTGVEK